MLCFVNGNCSLIATTKQWRGYKVSRTISDFAFEHHPDSAKSSGFFQAPAFSVRAVMVGYPTPNSFPIGTWHVHITTPDLYCSEQAESAADHSKRFSRRVCKSVHSSASFERDRQQRKLCLIGHGVWTAGRQSRLWSDALV
jgi:hypothetical protein